MSASVGRRMGLAALVVSAGVLLSRLLGFVREMVFAWVLGASADTDAYNVAFIIPDFINYLLAGGYLSITFIPIFTRHLARGDEPGAWQAFAAVFRVLAVSITALVLVGWLLAEPLVRALAPGFGPEQLELAVRLTRIVMPAQIFFVLGTLFMSVQYARERFLIPTLAPILYNVGIIAGGLLLGAFAGMALEGFAWGVLGGAAVGNFAVQWWGARRAGLRLPPGRWLQPSVGEYLLLALPLMVGQSIVVVDEWLGKIFGSLAPDGAITWLNYARRIMQVPVGVLAQAAGVAAYPFLARLFAEGRQAELSETLGRALRYVLFASFIAAAGLVALSVPVVRVAFERGAFAPEDTRATALALAIFALAVPVWGLQQIVVRGFYARREMWTPVLVGTVTTLVAVPLYWFLLRAYGFAGLAMAGTAAMLSYAAALAGVWYARTGWSHARPVAVSAVRGAAVAIAAGLAAWGAAGLVGRALPVTSFMGALMALLAGGATLAAGAIGAALLLRAPELEAVGAQLRRRIRR